jgi:hypothetical protein
LSICAALSIYKKCALPVKAFAELSKAAKNNDGFYFEIKDS